MSVEAHTTSHKTIDSLLARGEKLDSLVEKSTDLSMASQVRAESPRCCPLVPSLHLLLQLASPAR
eukprot:1028676-Prorocentrum_minimum.AAC.4